MSQQLKFKLNKEITDEDLEVILLYLENEKKSNGGDIANSKLDNLIQILTIEFESADVKQRVLAKSIHQCLQYTLIPFEVSRISDLAVQDDCELIANEILLKHISSNESMDVIRLYVEYLQPDNEILDVQLYSLVDSTFKITFGKDVDYDVLMKKMQKKPTLRNNTIKFYKCFKLNSIFMKKFNLTFSLMSQIVDSNQSKALRLYENELYYVLDGITESNGQLRERCLNYDVLCDETAVELQLENLKLSEESTVNSTVVETGSKTDVESMVEKGTIESVTVKTTIKTDESAQAKPVDSRVESVYMDLTNPLTLALLNCKRIYQDFQLNLTKINTKLEQTHTSMRLTQAVEPQHDKTTATKWRDAVQKCVQHYEALVHFAKFDLNNLRMLANYDDIIEKLQINITETNTRTQKDQQLYLYINNLNFLCILGYSKCVKNCYDEYLKQIKGFSTSCIDTLAGDMCTINVPKIYSSLLDNCDKIRRSLSDGLKTQTGSQLSNGDSIVVRMAGDMTIKSGDWYKCTLNYLSYFFCSSVRLDHLPASIWNDVTSSVQYDKTRLYVYTADGFVNIIGFAEDVDQFIGNCKKALFNGPGGEAANGQTAGVRRASGSEECVVQIDAYDLLCKLLYESDKVYKDFKFNLKAKNAFPSKGKQETGGYVVRPINSNGIKRDQWVKKIQAAIESYKKDPLMFETVQLPSNVDVRKLISTLNEFRNIKRLDYSFDVNCGRLQFCGFKKSILIVKGEIQTLIENEGGKGVESTSVQKPKSKVAELKPPKPSSGDSAAENAATVGSTPYTPTDQDEVTFSFSDFKTEDFVIVLNKAISALLAKSIYLFESLDRLLRSCNAQIQRPNGQTPNKLQIGKVSKGSATAKRWKQLIANHINKFVCKTIKFEVLQYQSEQCAQIDELIRLNQDKFGNICYTSLRSTSNSIKIWGFVDDINNLKGLLEEKFKPKSTNPVESGYSRVYEKKVTAVSDKAKRVKKTSILDNLIQSCTGSNRDVIVLNSDSLFVRAVLVKINLMQHLNRELREQQYQLVINNGVLTVINMNTEGLGDEGIEEKLRVILENFYNSHMACIETETNDNGVEASSTSGAYVEYNEKTLKYDVIGLKHDVQQYMSSTVPSSLV